MTRKKRPINVEVEVHGLLLRMVRSIRNLWNLRRTGSNTKREKDGERYSDRPIRNGRMAWQER